MRKLKIVSAIILCIFAFYGCEKSKPSGGGGAGATTNTDGTVDPNDADALSAVLIFPSGSSMLSGNPPLTSTNLNTPAVNNLNTFLTTSNGSTAPLNFRYSNVNGNLGGCYAQVSGASSYFNVPYNSTSSDSGRLQLPIGIPANVLEGTFDLLFCVYDNNNLVSNVITTTINVLRLGTGALQISLSWDTQTDQDLYVTDPSGEVISWEHGYSASGGELDRDDTDGFGPENIFWKDQAPDGLYKVRVHDYDDTQTPNIYYITITAPNFTQKYSGTVMNGDTAFVTNFTKIGTNITF